MFIKRALVTFTLGPLALYLIFRGGLFYFLPLTAILILATTEYNQIIQKMGWQSSSWVLVPAVVIQLAAGYWLQPDWLALALVVGLILVMAYALWLYERNLSQTALADWLAMTAGVVLLGWVGSHFFRLRGLEQMAWQWTALAMLSAWIADSAAYVVGKFMAGRILGRHQLSPRLSPNKTVEGYVGGIIIGTGLTVLSAIYLALPVVVALLLGLFTSAVAPVGDLGISMLKREAGVKDSGVLFPGHGGALDRIDTLVWSVTIAYYLALFAG